jgi:[acyl-carrier-protein] S-malonyltransferase
MTKRLAILCPGQGGQHQQMFDLARTDGRAKTLLDQWKLDSGSGMPLDDVLADDALLFSNAMAQPLIVAATLATWEALRNRLPLPTLVAGYSVGEVTSYHIAEAISAENAIDLARMRARLMDDCATTNYRQCLVAVSGLNAQALGSLLQGRELYVAIETDADSFIVGGLLKDAQDMEQSICRLGARINYLPVEVASHTPLMAAAVAPFAAELDRRAFADPKFPVVAGISAALIDSNDQAISTLSRQIAEKIRWADCMDACAEAGVTVALELGPGSALSRMLQARHPDIACRSAADFRTIEGIAAWVGRHFD